MNHRKQDIMNTVCRLHRNQRYGMRAMWDLLLDHFGSMDGGQAGDPEFDGAFLDCLQHVCGAGAASIWKLDRQSHLELVLSTDIKSQEEVEKVRRVGLTKGKGISGRAVLHRKTLGYSNVADTSVHDGEVDRVLKRKTGSMISSPIVWGEYCVFGVVNVVNVNPRAPLDDLKEKVELATRLYAHSLVQAGRYDAPSHKEIAGRYPYLKYAPNGSFARVVESCERYARYDDTVLLLGETGTGKELLARLIHEASDRAGELLPMNCGATRPERISDELFGHVKGAYTGADRSTDGFLGDVHRGTIFIDELGCLPLASQPALLRVLDAGTYNRIGETKARKFQGRIIAATQPNLIEKVRDGLFMEDLAYRIERFAVHVPPLRECPEDIPILMEHFLGEGSKTYKQPCPVFSDDAKHRFVTYTWPGNVRQMQNVIADAIVSFPGGLIDAVKVEKLLGKHTWARSANPTAPAPEAESDEPTAFEKKLRDAIADPQNHCKVGRVNKSKVARALGIHVQTLSKRAQEIGIDL